MARGGLALAALVAFIAGCPNGVGVAPTTRREALLRVNDNLSQISEPLQCKGLVSFKFRDADGRERAFIAHDARLIFEAPQSLRFDVKSLTGNVAQFGSNDTRYWVWIEPEVMKMWFGEWGRINEAKLRELPVPPQDLLDALMLRPLPECLDGGLLPVLRKAGDDHRLLFVRLGLDGQPVGLREIRLDPLPPHQPLEVVDRLPDGQITMHAVLRDYRRIGSDGPWTPRRYVVDWPENQAEMRLDILRVVPRPRADLPDDVFDFPAGWQGEIEQIDAPPRDPPRASTEAPLQP